MDLQLGVYEETLILTAPQYQSVWLFFWSDYCYLIYFYFTQLGLLLLHYKSGTPTLPLPLNLGVIQIIKHKGKVVPDSLNCAKYWQMLGVPIPLYILFTALLAYLNLYISLIISKNDQLVHTILHTLEWQMNE